MPQLWVRRDSEQWGRMQLTARGYRLGTDRPAEDETVAADGKNRGGVRLLRTSSEEGPIWVVIASTVDAVRVNGLPLAAGIRALVDRDEIVVGGRWTYYYSTEDPPEISVFRGAGRPAMCPRCCKEILPGESAVRCPGCGVWHHEDPESGSRCWTYAEHCAACAVQPTTLDAESVWTPVGL